MSVSSSCLHCGQPASEGQTFCCSGCEAAYAIVKGLGLDGYYRNRVLDENARPLVPALPARFDYARYTVLNDGEASIPLMVDGLHCAACVWLIENVLARENGVTRARINMTTRRLLLAWKPDVTSAAHLANIVAELGYRLAPYDPALFERMDRREEKFLLLCMAVAGFSAANVMLLSVSIWAGADMNAVTRDFLEWVSALVVLPAAAFAGQPFFRSASQALKGRRLNMDVPISLAVILTLGVSLYETAEGGGHTYFEAAIMLLFFLLIGRYLDRRVRTRARGAAERLLLLQANAATVRLPSGEAQTVAAAALKKNDIMLVSRGERFAADGVILEGIGTIDCSVVTGESLPVSVSPGSRVAAGSLSLDSAFAVRITAAGDDSTLSRIARLVEQATQAKNAYTRIADRVARYYAPVVHTLGAATFAGWWLAGAGVHTALLYAVAVLIVTCPCALALAVPAVQVAAASNLLRHGILLKNPEALEKLKDIDIVVFDKTGTLTTGAFRFVKGGTPEQLAKAASLAARSAHPLSQALVRAASAVVPAENVTEIPGQGLSCGDTRLGSAAFCGVRTEDIPADGSITALWFRDGGEDPVCFLFADTLRVDAATAVGVFRRAGVDVRLLSGDRENIAREIARTAGIENWAAGISPEGKHAFIDRLTAEGRKPLMVGDGINDAPALAAAWVSMSFGSATDIAQLSADMILQGDRLAGTCKAWEMARRAAKAIHINFILSIAYNVIAVPMAMAGMITPLFAALFMSASSLTVMLNSMRLNRP